MLASFAPTHPGRARPHPPTPPTLAILGEDDHDNGSVDALARIMPVCTPLRLPGDRHGRVVSTPAFRGRWWSSWR